MNTLVAQFTALRHEVNLQTKATRAAVEQNTKLLEHRPAADDSLRPLVKTLLDLADSLSLSLRQIDTVRRQVEPLLADLISPRLGDPPSRVDSRQGFLSSMFTRKAPDADPVRGWIEDALKHDQERAVAAETAIEKLKPFLAGVADGYAMSFRRVERILPQLGLEPIPTSGRPFDPNTMEVVEVAAGEPSGVVLEEVRRGYRWNGKVFRFAQVKVAR